MLVSIDDNIVETVWHKTFFEARRSDLKAGDFEIMIDRLNTIIDEKIASGEDSIVTSYIPGKSWEGIEWESIYNDACHYEEEDSAKFFGLLVCYVMIHRVEEWRFMRQDDVAGMKYFKREKPQELSLEDLMKKFN